MTKKHPDSSSTTGISWKILDGGVSVIIPPENSESPFPEGGVVGWEWGKDVGNR